MNFRRTFLWILTLLSVYVCAPSDASAQRPPLIAQADSDLRVVVARGIGSDVESAAKNAAENALTQVVGSVIDTEKQLKKQTELTNGIRTQSKQISTKTREYSQGSIVEFEVVNVETTNGLVNVTAKVAVKMSELKLFVARIAEGETTVSPGLFAAVAAKERNEDGLAGILTDRVLKPLMTGVATEFVLGQPITYEKLIASDPEWLAGLKNLWSQDQIQVYQQAGQIGKIQSSIWIKVSAKVSPSFSQNMTQSFEKIAHSKTSFQTPTVSDYDSFPQVLNSASNPTYDNNNFHIIVFQNPRVRPTKYVFQSPDIGDPDESFLRNQKDKEARRSGGIPLQGSFPPLVISLLNQNNEVIYQTELTNSYLRGEASTDLNYSGNIFVSEDKKITVIPSMTASHPPWSNVSCLDYYGFCRLWVNAQSDFYIAMTLSSEELKQTNKIRLEIAK